MDKIFEAFLAQSGVIFDIFLAALLGFVIGIERKLRGKEAGIKTHTIVAIGAALMMSVSMYAFDGGDTARVAAQIVSGVGFLGAGIIIYRKYELYGLTTAAGIWATAGIGMACVGRLYFVAIGVTLLLVLLQLLFHTGVGIFKSTDRFSVSVSFVQTSNENEKIKEIFGNKKFYKLTYKRENGQMICDAIIHTVNHYTSEELAKIINDNPFIMSLEHSDEC